MRLIDISSRKVRLIAFHVEIMSEADFDFAVQITDPMGWGLTRQDFEFAMEMEPEGCFVLLEGSTRIGVATTISFGNAAWFGNLIVDPNRRTRGGGSMLVNHALDYLKAKKVRSVGLYAYMDRIPFYQRLGFRNDIEFEVMKGIAAGFSGNINVKEIMEEDIGRVIDFDRRCFGDSRRKLLEPIMSDKDNLCLAYFEHGEILGYTVAKVYNGMAELGPLVCVNDRCDVAIGLLRSALGRLEGLNVSMFVPQDRPEISSMLTGSGFRQSFKVRRMFYGPRANGNCIYMAESLERG